MKFEVLISLFRELPHCVSFSSVEEYEDEITLQITLIRTPLSKVLRVYSVQRNVNKTPYTPDKK